MVMLSEAPERDLEAVSFTLGDSAALNADVLEQVRKGRKKVTCDALSIYADGGAPLPNPGPVDVRRDRAVAPAVAVFTLKVDMRRSCDITEEIILPIAAFCDLAAWRKGHNAELTCAFGADP